MYGCRPYTGTGYDCCTYITEARDNFLTSRQRQPDNVPVLEPQGQEKFRKILRSRTSVSRWSCHNEYSKNAKSNNFEACKHGHFVAAVLSHAQLCLHTGISKRLQCIVKGQISSRICSLLFLT